MRTIRAEILTFILGCAFTPTLFGQTFGEITGLVTDSSGAVVVGATVTVTNTQTNAARTTSTNNDGNYSFPALLPGMYRLKVQMQGLQTDVRDGVQLEVQQTARLDFQLNVGSMTETVTVTGGAPLLATENATVGTVIDNRRINDLPLNGRNFTALVALSSNVTAGFAASSSVTGREGGDRSTVAQIAVAGQRYEFTLYTIDGVSNSDVNYDSYAFLPSIDAIQEFKVQTGVYSVEFGRESTQVNISTKGGTNEYHGTAFDFIRNNFWDARPFGFTTIVPTSSPFKWNQFGYTLGGPMAIPKVFNGRDKLFFMTNYEGFRLRQQSQSVYSTIPVAMRAGGFSAILPGTVITDPLANNSPFPGNQMPSSRLNPAAVGLLQYDPLPNLPGLANNYQALLNGTEDKDEFLVRGDYVESAKSNWFGRYSWQSEYTLSPALGINGTTVTTNVSQAMISNARIITPNMVNDFRFAASNFHNILGYQNPGGDPTKELGIGLFDPAPVAMGVPYICPQGYSTFGSAQSGPWKTDDHTFQWVDNVSWTHGEHAIKVGTEIRRDRYNNLGNQNARGQLTIQNQATGYGVADFMLGYLYTLQDAGALGEAEFRATSQFYYLEDTWKVKPSVTVSLGVRYEYVPPWSAKNDTLVNVWIPPGFPESPAIPGVNRTYNGPHPCFVRIGTGDFNTTNTVVFNPAICTARDGRLGDRLVDPDYSNVAPRVGIAWSPNPETTVRIAAGRFYVHDIGNTVWDMAANLAGYASATESNHNLTFQNPFGGGATACPQPTPPYICISTPQGLANQPNPRTSYVDQWELNIQRQLDRNTAIELGYIGSESHFLQDLITLNEPLTMSATAAVNA